MLQFLRRMTCIGLMPMVVGSLWVAASIDNSRPFIPALDNDPTLPRPEPSVRIYLEQLKRAQRAVATLEPVERTPSL